MDGTRSGSAWSGETLTAIAAGLQVSPGFFSRVLHREPERTRAFRDAKRQWATALVEQTGELVKHVKEDRDAIGAAYLFPSPGDPTRPVSYELASTWLKRAERRAKLPKQRGTLWHAYRRKWATERKHLPIQDVMQAGGWSDPTCLQTMFQQPDEATLYLVVSQPAELREAKA